MRRPRLTYISGPISGYDLAERKRAFAAAADFINDNGQQAVNPLLNGLPDDAPRQRHMRVDIDLLLGCDNIYLLKGWHRSPGCRVELTVAMACGIKVTYEKDA